MAGSFSPGAPAPVQAAPSRSRTDAVAGSGWVAFAGVMLAIVGAMNFIYGIGALSDSRFYANETTYIIRDLNAYGWVLLGIGIIQIATAFGIWARADWARWVGVFSAGCNAIVQMLFIAAFPLAAMALLAIDVLVIYGLVAHGGSRGAAS